MSRAELFPADGIDVNAISLPPPKVLHRELGHEEIKQRMIVVGDVHGCLDELKDVLAKASFDPEDTSVLLLGDLVNKGYYSAEVVHYAREIGAFCIRGNHEDYMLKFALGLVPKPRPAILDFIDKLSADDIEWLKELPYSIAIPSWKTLCVHAGLVPGRPLLQQNIVDIITMRNVVQESNGLVGTSKDSQGAPWVDHWTGDLDGREGDWTVLFGHDAKRGLQWRGQAIGLDSGCAYGKQLSALVLPSRELVQVPARQVYQSVEGKD